MKFTDISRFDRVSDYLPILNAAILTDLFGIVLLLSKNIESKYLREWYKKYTLSAVIMDVLILVIGAILARLVYPFFFSSGFSLIGLATIAVIIQVTHDILFAMGFNMIPRGKSDIVDLFQDYGKEIGVWILVADAVMMVSTIVFGSLFASLSLHANILLLIGLVYLIQYILLSV
jgi:hypothetical protein